MTPTSEHPSATRPPATSSGIVLIRDQADRDAIASDLLRYRDSAGDELAEIIDTLTMHPVERRKVVRLLSEIEARDGHS